MQKKWIMIRKLKRKMNKIKYMMIKSQQLIKLAMLSQLKKISFPQHLNHLKKKSSQKLRILLRRIIKEKKHLKIKIKNLPRKVNKRKVNKRMKNYL